MFRRLWPLFLVLLVPAAVVATVSTPKRVSQTVGLDEREQQVWQALARDSQFNDVPHTSARSRCEDVQPPQALATPAPLLTQPVNNRKVKVSFIIGTDGRVHSPLILESAGPRGDRNVLQTVRTWRYRPAMCNGVPTETEGKIEFSSR
jgi:TonB family protein